MTATKQLMDTLSVSRIKLHVCHFNYSRVSVFFRPLLPFVRLVTTNVNDITSQSDHRGLIKKEIAVLIKEQAFCLSDYAG